MGEEKIFTFSFQSLLHFSGTYLNFEYQKYNFNKTETYFFSTFFKWRMDFKVSVLFCDCKNCVLSKKRELLLAVEFTTVSRIALLYQYTIHFYR